MLGNIAGAMNRYMQGKYGKMPRVEVTRAEFVQLLIDRGATPKEAEFQATISTGMNASCEIGGRMVKIKPEPPAPAPDHVVGEPSSDAANPTGS